MSFWALVLSKFQASVGWFGLVLDQFWKCEDLGAWELENLRIFRRPAGVFRGEGEVLGRVVGEYLGSVWLGSVREYF